MTDIVVDTSAIVAIVMAEPTADRLLAALTGAGARAMSAFSVLETSVVLQRRFGPAAEPLLNRFVAEAGIEVLPFDADQLALARAAATTFGKSRHAARLNLGDCCAYAAAKRTGRPLLCVGDDFPETDLPLATW